MCGVCTSFTFMYLLFLCFLLPDNMLNSCGINQCSCSITTSIKLLQSSCTSLTELLTERQLNVANQKLWLIAAMTGCEISFDKYTYWPCTADENKSIADLNCTELTATATWYEQHRCSNFDCNLTHLTSLTFRSPFIVFIQSTKAPNETQKCQRCMQSPHVTLLTYSKIILKYTKCKMLQVKQFI